MNLEHPKRTIYTKLRHQNALFYIKSGYQNALFYTKPGYQNALFYIKPRCQNALFYIKPRCQNALFYNSRHSTLKHFTISERIAFPIKNNNSLPRTYPVITMHHHAHTHKSYQSKTGNAILVDIYLFILPSKNINIIFANTASLIKPFIYDYKGGNCTL